ncbi:MULTISPECIES: hypothetical protein [unclassified Streptomyces]|uniref:hypothetical protein n=1 Tax=unclassified Streptomyces TaxID=2593676 RepID=UPI00339F34F8
MTLLAVVSRTALAPGTVSGGRNPVHRVRTVLLRPGSRTPTVDEHVSVRLRAGERWSRLGDVLIERGTGATRAAETAVAHPGALVVAVHDGSHCWMRLGTDGPAVLAFESAGPGGPGELWETLASLAHAWLVAGLPAELFGRSMPYAWRAQLPDPPGSNRRSRCRAVSASGDPDRPAEA